MVRSFPQWLKLFGSSGVWSFTVSYLLVLFPSFWWYYCQTICFFSHCGRSMKMCMLKFNSREREKKKADWGLRLSLTSSTYEIDLESLSIFQNIHQGYPTDTLVRFLKARNWNVPKAHKMVRSFYLVKQFARLLLDF